VVVKRKQFHATIIDNPRFEIYIEQFPRSISLPPCPMVKNIPDGRSPIAVAMHWASRVTTISIQMVLPLLLGVWIDKRLGTKAVFTILGGIAGLWLGIWTLIRLAKLLAAGDEARKKGDRGKDT
jgi:hypothetical protein